jgi:hypothetical protein
LYVQKNWRAPACRHINENYGRRPDPFFARKLRAQSVGTKFLAAVIKENRVAIPPLLLSFFQK